jgi:undecaprenyl-diphosphatase
MGFFNSIILGIVEGITEFLPISSTGHLILFSELFKIPQTEFVKSFEIVIQLGAILSVVVLYWRKLLLNKKIFWRVVVAFLPTAVLGLIFYKLIKTYLLGNAVVVLLSLFIGGIGLILFEKWYQKKPRENQGKTLEEISFKDSLFIGLFQSVAMIPGVSRAAATIVGGLFLGIKRRTIVEFSFLLAVPTMAAATGLDLLKSAAVFSAQEFVLLAAGFFVSFVVAIFAIKFLLSFIEKNTFVSFGWYRIIVSIIFALVIFL